MITPEEREEIINAAVERALLSLPDALGNLMSHQAMFARMNKEFYQKYPEFAKQKEVVARVLEGVEAENPGMDYKLILEKAVPVIKDTINNAKSLDMSSLGKLDKRIPDLTNDNGAI